MFEASFVMLKTEGGPDGCLPSRVEGVGETEPRPAAPSTVPQPCCAAVR